MCTNFILMACHYPDYNMVVLFNRLCCKGNLLWPIIWKQYPDLSSDMSSVWCIKTLVPQRSFGRKTSDCVVGWRLYSQVSRQTQRRICFILPAYCVSKSSQRGDKIILPASRKVLWFVQKNLAYWCNKEAIFCSLNQKRIFLQFRSFFFKNFVLTNFYLHERKNPEVKIWIKRREIFKQR